MRRSTLPVVLLTLISCNNDVTVPTEPVVSTATIIELSGSEVDLSSLGQSVQLTATVKDQSGGLMQGQLVTWASSDAAIVTVSEGLVTAVSNGSVTITVSSGSASATASATVSQVAAALTLSDRVVSFVMIGDTVRLSAMVEDAGGSEMPVPVTWSSSDTLVASVDSTGLVTSAGNGSTSISAGVGQVSAEAAATVSQVSAGVLLSDSVLSFASLGDTVRLTAEVQDSAGVAIEGAEIVWTSSDMMVATVSAGLVTAVSNGMATVSATSDGATRSASATISQVAASIELGEDTVRLANVGDDLKIFATVLDGLGEVVEGVSLTWSSTDSSAVTVNSTGGLSSKASGRATVTASLDGLEASVHVVSAPFYLAANGRTIVCFTAAVGDTATVGNTKFTKLDRTSLIRRVEAANASGDYGEVTASCVSGLQDLSALFDGAENFDGDISSWDTSETSTMTRMFAGATSFNQDLEPWDVSAVSRMDGMFDGATDFNQNITTWDVGSVQAMDLMFRDAVSFNHDLSAWCVSELLDPPQSFASGTSQWTLPHPVWGSCSNISLVQTLVTAFPSSLLADGRATTTITVYPKDAAGRAQTVATTDVGFQDPPVGALSAVTSVGPGAYAVTYTAGTSGGPTTLTPTLDQGLKVLASVQLDELVPPGRIAYARWYQTGDLVPGIYVWDFTDNSESLLWEVGGARSLSWSPDGGTLAFVASGENGRDLWTIKADGSLASLLIPDARFPTWSPDGQEIAFSRRSASGDYDLLKANSDGSGVTQLTDSIDVLYPAWSPLGGTIAFQGQDGVYLLDLATNDRARFNLIEQSTRPTWSPDGARIVFTEDGDVFEASVDGSRKLNLTRSPSVFESYAVYAPDSSLLAYRVEGDDCSGEGVYLQTPDRSMRYRVVRGPDDSDVCTGVSGPITWGR